MELLQEYRSRGKSNYWFARRCCVDVFIPLAVILSLCFSIYTVYKVNVIDGQIGDQQNKDNIINVQFGDQQDKVNIITDEIGELQKNISRGKCKMISYGCKNGGKKCLGLPVDCIHTQGTHDRTPEFDAICRPYEKCKCPQGFKGDDCRYPTKQRRPGRPNHSNEQIDSMCAGKVCYKLVEQLEDWMTASAKCNQRDHGFLAEVRSKAQNNLIEQLVVQMRRKIKQKNWLGLWIGGHDIGNEGNWTWQHSGDQISMRGQRGYQNWMKGEPNDLNGEHCLHVGFFDGPRSWNDLLCNKTLPFVCQTIKGEI